MRIENSFAFSACRPASAVDQTLCTSAPIGKSLPTRARKSLIGTLRFSSISARNPPASSVSHSLFHRARNTLSPATPKNTVPAMQM